MAVYVSIHVLKRTGENLSSVNQYCHTLKRCFVQMSVFLFQTDSLNISVLQIKESPNAKNSA